MLLVRIGGGMYFLREGETGSSISMVVGLLSTEEFREVASVNEGTSVSTKDLFPRESTGLAQLPICDMSWPTRHIFVSSSSLREVEGGLTRNDGVDFERGLGGADDGEATDRCVGARELRVFSQDGGLNRDGKGGSAFSRYTSAMCGKRGETALVEEVLLPRGFAGGRGKASTANAQLAVTGFLVIIFFFLTRLQILASCRCFEFEQQDFLSMECDA